MIIPASVAEFAVIAPAAPVAAAGAGAAVTMTELEPVELVSMADPARSGVYRASMLSVPAVSEPAGMPIVALPLDSVAGAEPKLPMVRATVPVAVELLVPPPTATVTVNGCAVEMVDAEGVTVIVVGLTPVPVRAMVCGDPVALSAMVTAAVSGPTAAGVKCP